MSDDAFSEFIDQGVRGSNGSVSSALCNQLKMFHQKLHLMFTGGAFFRDAPEATQVVFAYDGLEPYWEYMPRVRKMITSLIGRRVSSSIAIGW